MTRANTISFQRSPITAAVAAALTLAGAPGSAAAGTSVIALSGNAAPGTEPGVTFGSVGNASLNNAGQVVFTSFLAGAGVTSANNQSIWRDATLVAREGAAAIYDDVINNGEIRTSTGGASVFFGAVAGAGSFTGIGTVFFEGDLRPGNSPAPVVFGGDVALGAASSSLFELGGLTRGSEYDGIDVAGALTLDGTLNIALLNAFDLQAGAGGGVASEFGSGGSDRGGAAQAHARRVTEFTWEGWI